jgi:UDP-glucose:(heptosyl)LPS alpha-1,3-glucosyltransferase
MKIALVRQRYTAFGGAERFVARAIHALQVGGAEVTLVTRQWAGADKGEDKIRSLVCNPFYLGNLWRDWGFSRCVCRVLAEQGFDLVQSHERLACCDVYRAGDGVHREWLKQRGRVLGVSGRAGIWLNPYHHYVLGAERRLFTSPRLKAVICNSQMVKSEIRHHFGLAESKLHVIYSGVDLQSFHPTLRGLHRKSLRSELGVSEEAAVFLFVGSGFERKGVAAILEAMTLLPGNEYLLVVGKDKKLDKFKALARKQGLDRRVQFLGGQEDVRPFYGAADALVLPTLYDPFPNVALEAMAAGLPVVTSKKSGAAEFIRPGENGYVCDALDTPALASHMRQLLNADRCQQMGQAARASVESYSLETMAERLLDLYRSLLPVAQPPKAE